MMQVYRSRKHKVCEDMLNDMHGDEDVDVPGSVHVTDSIHHVLVKLAIISALR